MMLGMSGRQLAGTSLLLLAASPVGGGGISLVTLLACSSPAQSTATAAVAASVSHLRHEHAWVRCEDVQSRQRHIVCRLNQYQSVSIRGVCAPCAVDSAICILVQLRRSKCSIWQRSPRVQRSSTLLTWPCSQDAEQLCYVRVASPSSQCLQHRASDQQRSRTGHPVSEHLLPITQDALEEKVLANPK